MTLQDIKETKCLGCADGWTKQYTLHKQGKKQNQDKK